MTSALEITAPITLARDRLGPFTNKAYTPYPYTQTFFNPDEEADGEIQPYMARAHSPIRVTFTPKTMGMKRKSRVSEAARSANLNYRPLKRGDQSTNFRFRAPDATLPTLQYLSPWISVTKTDFKDPRLSEYNISYPRDLTPGFYRRSYTEGSFDISHRNTPAILREDFKRMSESPSLKGSRKLNTRETSVKSGSSTGKRVKIFDPAEADELEKAENQRATPATKTKLKEIKQPESGVNYYSGYLPPELSEEISEKLNIIAEKSTEGSSENTEGHFSLATQFSKPLVGDRTYFLHESYPAQPKIMRSDIDQLRLEGRKRLLQSHGQAPAHYSALKHRGTLARPKQKGVRLDEAVREQQRQTNSRLTRQATSLEIYQQQRDRTYNLQNLAREMINK